MFRSTSEPFSHRAARALVPSHEKEITTICPAEFKANPSLKQSPFRWPRSMACRQGATVRCQFPKHSHFLPWADVWLIAIHNGVPRWLSWVHPKLQAPRMKRTILLDITAGGIQPGYFAGEVRADIESTGQ